MGSKILPKLPTINLGGENAKVGSSSWIRTSNEVRQALEDYGCFIAIYDKKVNLDLHNKVFQVIQPMFELSTQVKSRNTSNIPYHGYYKPVPVMPLLESFGVEGATLLHNTRAFTNLLWSNGNQHFCETVHEYAKQTAELERVVTRMVFESYGVEKYLDSHIDSTTYLLRIAKYRVPEEENQETLGAVAHTDKNFITVLHQSDVDGLEVLTKHGDHWIPYHSSPHSFVVMAGELCLAWSNNRIHAPVHQVIMKGEKERYSLALFSRSKGTIKTPKELVDDEHPLLFKPFDYMGLLNFYTEDVSRMSYSTIKDYCGLF